MKSVEHEIIDIFKGLIEMVNKNELFNTSPEEEQIVANLDSNSSPNFSLESSYQITYDALPHESIEKLPIPVQDRAEELHELAQTQPLRVIAPLLDLIEKYPDVPVFYNYLTAVYEMTGQRKKTAAIIEKAYQKHPDYIFAKTNYAIQCLRNKTPEKISDIFDHKLNLKLLYPHRQVFHIAEFASFKTVMVLYHLAIGQREVAKKYFKILQELEPNHYLTKTVRDQLYPNIFRKFWGKVNNYLGNLDRKLDRKIAFLEKTDISKRYSNYSKEF